MVSSLNELLHKIQEALKTDLLEDSIAADQLSIVVPVKAIAKILTYLRDAEGLLFRQLVDLCGVDYPARTPRFEVVYHLLSLKHNQRLRVKIRVDEADMVPSICSIFRSANWLEREVWDMYGIRFAGHPDLRRLLTDYGFDGFPMRKDFPLIGRVQVRYDQETKQVQNEPVNLQQQFRSFDFESPWEGMVTAAQHASPIIPGDEKAADKQEEKSK
ncbi:MAG: NADH-quinone oxidoreductase subunit C [Pseudomonadota bacterium]